MVSPHIIEHLEYIINHVFLPPKLPQKEDYFPNRESALCDLVFQTAGEYCQHLPEEEQSEWRFIVRMVKNIATCHQSDTLVPDDVEGILLKMQQGDVLPLLIRAQNAAVIMRKLQDQTIFESFEVSPAAAEVLKATGKLLCSYPGPAIAVPNNVIGDSVFRRELVSFLVQMNVDVLDSAKTTTKAKSTVVEVRDTSHPRYITQLLTGILRGVGSPADVPRICKRIADDVLWKDAYKPWRRSSIWLVIRVALQTSLYRTDAKFGRQRYKSFMVYLMSKLVRLAVDAEYQNDLIHCMRAKLSGRLYKLGSAVHQFLVDEVAQASEVVAKKLTDRWELVQYNQAQSPQWAPDTLNILEDTRQSLVNSGEYLRRALTIDSHSNRPIVFNPSQHPRLLGPLSSDFDRLDSAFRAESVLGLADFEQIVQTNLDGWLPFHLHDSSALVKISESISTYANYAQQCYANNPENLSTMLLTIFHLWVAVDKMAVAQCPLLQEYSPEIPPQLLEVLLLRSNDSIHQLSNISSYIKGRHRKALHGTIFADNAITDTFAVRYFDSSRELRALKDRIEQVALYERDQKKKQLASLNAQYRELKDKAQRLDHTYRGWRRTHKQRKCQKCQLDKEADNLTIEVHEWPLPDHHQKAKIVVFELRCPISFRTWRTITYQVLRDICRVRPGIPADFEVVLKQYRGLLPFVESGQISRVTIASSTKSFYNSHYKRPSIPASESTVCVNNGLSFRLYDADKDRWACNPSEDCSLSRSCTLELPCDGPYQSLQFAVDSTTHTSNDILASQSDCPKDLGLHEYIQFGTLRSGCRIQWLNILRELRTRSLRFHREEVHTLLMQAAWQIGPLSADGTFDWHSELSCARFGTALLEELRRLLQDVETSWLEAATVRTITLLTSRLLASASGNITSAAYLLLRDARKVTVGWLRDLLKMLQANDNDIGAIQLQRRISEVATICRATYDVDTAHIDHLMASVEDVAVFLECAIHLYDNQCHDIKDPTYTRVIARDRRLSQRLESRVLELIMVNRASVDNAILAVWSAYHPGAFWRRLSSPNDRWISTQTGSQEVHLNVLDGQLLVDGLPLRRLPQLIVDHPTYSRIFGKKVLDVIPANMPGMNFATRTNINNNQIFFALRGNSLVVRARANDKTFELIPIEVLYGDLPTFFVEQYAHWLCVHSDNEAEVGTMEFRPLQTMWEYSPQNWRLYLSSTRPCEMRTKSRILFDNRSKTFNMISAHLSPLESAHYMTISCSLEGDSLTVDLPRYSLSFFLNSDGHLESNNFLGLVVDAIQSAGTLFGLVNQLVLRPRDPVILSLTRSRRVIIPHSTVKYQLHDNHVLVRIDTGSSPRVRYHDYKVDDDLGCLVGSGSLLSRLYKVYLHALTSHCLPDPLLKQTGLEEALHDLQSAGCWSFQRLNSDEEQLLMNIAALTPRRTFYPQHLKVMQTVMWSKLPPSSQHNLYLQVTQSIIDYARDLELFYKDPIPQCEDSDFDTDNSCVDQLRVRALLRARQLYPADCERLPLASEDLVYNSRDFLSNKAGSKDEGLVRNTALLVNMWPSNLDTDLSLFQTMERWGLIAGPTPDFTLSYNRMWLSLDLPSIWLSFYNACRASTAREARFQLLFSLAAVSYTSEPYRHLVPTMLSFATVTGFRSLHPPRWDSYNLSDGVMPRESEILSAITSSALRVQETSVPNTMPIQNNESRNDYNRRLHAHHSKLCDTQSKEYLRALINQWPCLKPAPPQEKLPRLFNVTTFMSLLSDRYRSWHHNKELKEHLTSVQKLLNSHRRVVSVPPMDYTFDSCRIKRTATIPAMTLLLLLTRRVPNTTLSPKATAMSPQSSTICRPVDTTLLHRLLIDFRQNAQSSLCRQYADDLTDSLKFLDRHPQYQFPNEIFHSTPFLCRYRNACRTRLDQLFMAMCDVLYPMEPIEQILFQSGRWPSITPRSLLELLASTAPISVTEPWKSILLSFAHEFMRFQRSQRLVELAYHRRHEEYHKELANLEIESCSQLMYPDWLLIQIEGNFLIRSLQRHVAKEMSSPTSGKNTILQLNMGEGKTSVIAPLILATLADGKTMVRVVVLKPLANQMFQILRERLGGLANRRIFYMPFSRKVRADESMAQTFRKLYQLCAKCQGVLVVQPEHILSFKLMGIDKLFHSTSNEEQQAMEELLNTQRWLENNTRDVLDESDEILDVRYQLVYTVGQQSPVEHHPDRWIILQHLFSLLLERLLHMQEGHSEGFELQGNGPGAFPYIRILQSRCGESLIDDIAQDVINGAIPNLTFAPLRRDVRTAVRCFIRDSDVTSTSARLAERHCKGSALWPSILLLRGLLAHGILVYLLRERRWRVDYGLDESRSLLAVPYRAKDVPALRAEFGHPDVAIGLTCLSYYYRGLTEDQLNICFQILYNLDNPTIEYESWVRRDTTIPHSYRELRSINIEDREGWKSRIFPWFSYNKAVIDFYLSRVVFPRAAKEFSHKLITSAWDLAETKAHVTTGFSGTNDNRFLLPTSISQADPVGQLSTNAKVLSYLLQPENGTYLCVRGRRAQEPPSAKDILDRIVEQTPEIRVLLDVGAQMLEYHNRQVVEQWLRARPEIPAGIFFNDNDELVVMTQDRNVESFVSSPFNQQLGSCVVYLDDAHTRGTDLKLPPGTRAAVTIGPKVTKDRLLQGCMRMRKLGNGHSLMFIAPPETDRSIRQAAKRAQSGKVYIADILRWAMLETCEYIHRHIPHWARQGYEYEKGKEAWSMLDHSSVKSSIVRMKSGWLQRESQTLEEMYGYQPSGTLSDSYPLQIPGIRKRCQKLGIIGLSGTRMDEEQEREVSHEVEVEHQVERPPPAQGATHKVHPSVLAFVKECIIPATLLGFVRPHATVKIRGSLPNEEAWSARLLFTKDFATTIKTTTYHDTSDYLRPIHWIVSSQVDPHLVVFSPFEVDELLPIIRQSRHVRLHIYAPRVTETMRPLDDLIFHCIPPLPSNWTTPLIEKIQLNLWAGQLYIPEYEEYLMLCQFLGVYTKEYLDEFEDSNIQSDGFIEPKDRRGSLRTVCQFKTSPVPFLKELIGLRRKGMSYQRTHLGRVLHAQLLDMKDFS